DESNYKKDDNIISGKISSNSDDNDEDSENRDSSEVIVKPIKTYNTP
ncbi:18767_t:CDS:2, partial [Racocetra fulgida]